VTYLLDVNSLLALAHALHIHHERMEAWVRSLSRRDRLATCAITELGFVRIAPQVGLSPDLAAARALLAALRENRRLPFVRLADDLGADSLPSWVRTPGQTTDGHLVALAEARNARLATLDEAIPDAVRIP
jgi:toxin-antitoxin system PIN domain toxin